MRFVVEGTWAGDDQRVYYVWDTVRMRIISRIFRDDYRGACEECSRLNSKEGTGNAA